MTVLPIAIVAAVIVGGIVIGDVRRRLSIRAQLDTLDK